MSRSRKQPASLKHSALHIGIMSIAIIAVAMLTISLQARPISAGAGHNVEGYAWSDVVGGGWISMNSENDGSTLVVDYGVNIDSSGVWSGRAWSPNHGWVSFGASGECGSGVTVDLGAANPAQSPVSGYALVESLRTSNAPASENHGGVTPCIDMSSLILDQTVSPLPRFSGFAWHGSQSGTTYTGLGWIDFSEVTVDLEKDAWVELGGRGSSSSSVTCGDDDTISVDHDNVDPNTCVVAWGSNNRSASKPDFTTDPVNASTLFTLTCDHIQTGSPISDSHQVTCNSVPQCSDSTPSQTIDNDNDGAADQADSSCWTDCTNPSTYDPSINDESRTCEEEVLCDVTGDCQAPEYREN